MKRSSRTTTRRKWDWFLFGGIVLGIWATANTYLGFARYGADQGVYWWFCNLALIGTAFGLLAKHRGWLLGFLSIACFTQVFWILDNIARLFFRRNVFGLVEFMYRPGMSVLDFALTHYHYFTIPVCLLALYFLPSKKKSNALLLVCIFNPLIFGVSYFAFPAKQNVNCIHEPCFPPLEHLGGPTYSLLFWAGIFAVHLAFVFGFEKLFAGLKRTKARGQAYVQAFGAVTALCVGLSAWDIQYKLSLPNFSCNAATEDSFTRIGCDYTLEDSPGKMVFGYRIKNKTGEGLLCITRAQTQYNAFVLNEEVALAPGESKRVEQILPYPDVSVDVSLSAHCRSTGERAVAGEKP